MLVSVESTNKFDSNTLPLDCADEEFRTLEVSLYQVLHRTTANEPLRMGTTNTRTEGIRHKFSICSIDRAKDVEQFDDIPTTFS